MNLPKIRCCRQKDADCGKNIKNMEEADMKWSRYSILFKSKRNGWLLFHSASRSFLKVKDTEIDIIKEIMKNPEGYDYSEVPMLYMQLRALGYLAEDQQDDDLYNIIKMKHLTHLYDGNSLMLTIAVTRACNFDCSYCFEGNRTGKPMSQKVEDKLIAFIRNFKAENLGIVWYGGEPLLAFDRILSIDRRIREMGKTYHASMITNGYLLTEEKIAKLNDLNITYLQITLDGKKETHDGRRYLKNGAPTFEVILNNIDKVLKTDFKGTIHIRVNVDGRNDEEFADVYNMIRLRYPGDFGRRITVYPGFVKGDDHPDASCFFEPKEQGEFISKMVRNHKISPLPLFPRREVPGCTLTRRNAFVVGPDGELYKCWDDVGLKEKVVGSVDRFHNWNMALIAEGMTGCSYLDSEECRQCFCFPICNGGCHRIRQKNLHSPNKHSSCSYFKDNLEELLELYYEWKLELAEKQKQCGRKQKSCVENRKTDPEKILQGDSI